MLEKIAQAFRGRGVGVLNLSGLIAIAVLVEDLLLPLGVAGGVPYILPVLVMAFYPTGQYILVMAGVCSIFTIIGYSLTPPAGELWIVLANRGLVLFAIWATAVFAFLYKRAAASSALNEERYALALAATNDGLWDRDIATNVCYFSPRWLDILGYREGEILGHNETFYKLLHPEDRDPVWANSQAHLNSGVLYDTEARLRHKDNSYVWVRIRGRAVYDEDGKPVRMAGSISDISQLKQMETGLRNSESRLKEGQRIARIGSWELDLTDSTLIWSDEIYRIFEIDRSQFGATYEAFLDAIHPDDKEIVNKAYTESLAKRTPYQVTHRLCMPDGRIKWVEEHCESDFDAHGNPLSSRGTVQDITALTIAEEAKRESQERFRDVAESMSDWIWELGPDLRFSWVSPSAEKVLGQPAEHFIGKLHEDLGPPGQNIRDWERLLEDLHAHRPFDSLNYRRTLSDGRVLHMATSGKPLFDADGAFRGYRGTGRDISAELMAREENIRLQERFLEAIDQMPDQIGLYDSDARIVHFNRQFAIAGGGAENNIKVGMSLEEILRERIRAGKLSDAAIGREEEWLAGRVARFGNSDGSWEFERDGEVFETREEKLADGGTMVIVSNITARKQNEHALRESEARYRSLIENSNLGIHVGSPSKGRIFANQACADLFGYASPEDLIAASKMDLIAEHDREKIAELRTQVFDGTALESSCECDALCKDGTIIPLQVFMQRITWEGEDALLRTFVDLSDRKRAEEQLQQSQKMEAVGQLTGGIAHEFNNLLMVIVGNLEMTLSRVSDDAGRKYASTAMNGAMRGAELTSQLLSFSRKQTLRAEETDPNELVRSMHEMLRHTLSETVSMAANFSPDIWQVHVDKGLLENAVLNLALNARDAMPRGGTISIATTNQTVGEKQLTGRPDVAPGDFVRIDVSDTGTGMAPDIVEHVFEPFFSTKDVGQGTGLGLSMVHGFVEQSGGFVHIESHLDKGTSVYVYLPRVAAPEVTPEPEPGAQSENPIPSINSTVLVVEDKPDVRKVVVRILTDLGCAVVEAEDGKSALVRLAEHPDIDMLFTDVVLPEGMSGPEIAVEARRIKPDLKIILTSGYPDEEVNDRVSGGEFPWFIRKPYRKSEIAVLLDRVLQS